MTESLQPTTQHSPQSRQSVTDRLRMRLDRDERHRNLPDRVRQAIVRQQDRSERLIGWVQLAIVTVFSTLYLAAPKTFADDAEFEPVPWVLAFYAVVTVARLILAYRGRLPDSLLYASVVIDMAVLIALIWSFHLQYMQPPSFYLKAPTLLYVFIFIALRALRFEARFVIAAGVVAALGWTLLAGFAVFAVGTEMVTQDYVKYMTSNSVLIGAELDKIISILVVTVILAVAISRARALLVQAAAEGAAAEDLSRFFSPEIAREITESEDRVSAGSGRERDAAILFCDIRGFTRHASHVTPDALIAALADYQRLVVPIIESHGGTIDKFMGDGIMATFGAAVPSETYAADALRTIDAILPAVDGWNATRRAAGMEEFRIGLAASSGKLVFGAVGNETRLEYTVIGDAVNRTAKLENQTKAEQVRALTDADTWDRALSQGYDRDTAPETRPASEVEGVDGTVDLVVLGT